MAHLVIRKARLRRRAIRHGQSMEEEVCDILRNAVRAEENAPAPLGIRLRDRFASIGLNEDILELRGQKARATIVRK